MKWTDVLVERSDDSGFLPLKKAAQLVSVINRATVQDHIERAVLLVDLFARVAKNDLIDLVEVFVTTWDPAVCDTENTIEGDQFTSRDFAELSGYANRASRIEEAVSRNPSPRELAEFVTNWLTDRPKEDHVKAVIVMVAGLLALDYVFPYSRVDPKELVAGKDSLHDEDVIVSTVVQCFRFLRDPRFGDVARGKKILEILTTAPPSVAWRVVVAFVQSHFNEHTLFTAVNQQQSTLGPWKEEDHF